MPWSRKTMYGAMLPVWNHVRVFGRFSGSIGEAMDVSALASVDHGLELALDGTPCVHDAPNHTDFTRQRTLDWTLAP